MSKIEEVIKMIYRIYRKKHNQPNSPCPDEEILVCFSEGRLSKSDSARIKEHLISCRHCSEAVSLFCQRFEEQREVPEFLVKKVKDLVKQKPLPNILNLILVLKEKALQILESSGDVVLDNEIIPLPVLRSRQISEFPEEIRLIKEFKDIKVTLFVQKRDKDKIRINLNLVDKVSLMPIENLRMVLLKDAQELESYEAASGSVVFDKVGFGRYNIQIMRKHEELGAINLEIK